MDDCRHQPWHVSGADTGTRLLCGVRNLGRSGYAAPSSGGGNGWGGYSYRSGLARRWSGGIRHGARVEARHFAERERAGSSGERRDCLFSSGRRLGWAVSLRANPWQRTIYTHSDSAGDIPPPGVPNRAEGPGPFESGRDAQVRVKGNRAATRPQSKRNVADTPYLGG